MSRAVNVDCDMCGEILRGRKGIAWIEKSHIALRGMMTLQRKPGDFTYVTRDKEEEMHFCDFKCLSDFAEVRRLQHEEIQGKQRRESARLSATVEPYA